LRQATPSPQIAASNNALLTGLPRSGSTLACELLNELPDTVALDEPMSVRSLTGDAPKERPASGGEPPDTDAICDEIERFLASTRDSLHQDRTAPSKHVGGQVSGRKITDDYADSGERVRVVSRGQITVEKPLTPAFLLVIKHPVAFTALLEPLVQRFDVYATVRNPLALLGSWQTVPLGVRDGRLPVAERIDFELERTLSEIEDPADRQLQILSWFFERYETFLPADHVIPYESIIATGGKALRSITDRASALEQPLQSRNTTAIYDREGMASLGERLLDSDGPYWNFYSRDSVSALLAA
jgi:hypothetical protein